MLHDLTVMYVDHEKKRHEPKPRHSSNNSETVKCFLHDCHLNVHPRGTQADASAEGARSMVENPAGNYLMPRHCVIGIHRVSDCLNLSLFLGILATADELVGALVEYLYSAALAGVEIGFFNFAPVAFV